MFGRSKVDFAEDDKADNGVGDGDGRVTMFEAQPAGSRVRRNGGDRSARQHGVRSRRVGREVRTEEERVAAWQREPSFEFTSVPSTDRPVPSAEKRARRTVRLMVLALPVALVALAVSVGAIAAAGSAGSGGGDRDTDSEGFYLFVGQAELVAREWLEGSAVSLPSVGSLDVVDARTFDDPGTALVEATVEAVEYDSLIWLRGNSVLGGGDVYVENHTFLVGAGGVFSELTVAVADLDGPVLAALPSLSEATAGVASADSPLNWSLVFGGGAQLRDETERQVARWADAYAGNDCDVLFALTNDPLSNRYRGLGGWVVPGEPEVLQAVQRDQNGEPSMIVQVRVPMHSVDTPGVRVTNDYDLLFNALDRATPNLVAWGAAGSGPFLVPYQNAVAVTTGDGVDLGATCEGPAAVETPASPTGEPRAPAPSADPVPAPTAPANPAGAP